MYDKDVVMLQVGVRQPSAILLLLLLLTFYLQTMAITCDSLCYLQIAASKMDPNHFLMLILLRFELFEYFNGSFSSKDQASNT